MMHVAYSHLREAYSVLRALDAIVVLSAREPIPYRSDLGGNGRRGPIRITVVGHHASQVLELFVLVLHTGLQPVVAVEVYDDAALVKAPVAFREVSLHDEAEEPLLRLHLEDRGVVVAEMIIGTLPKVCARSGDHLDGVTLDEALRWLSRPFEKVYVQFHLLLILCQIRRYASGRGGVRPDSRRLCPSGHISLMMCLTAATG